MHEMSLCESIMQIIEQQAEREMFSRVTRVRLEIGRLACVESQAMQFSFEVVTRGTLAEGARLEIVWLPGHAWCMTCAMMIEVDRRFDTCRICGGQPVPSQGGDELRVKDLEVE